MNTDGLFEVNIDRVVASYYANNKYNYIEQYKNGNEYLPIATNLFKAEEIIIKDEKTQEIIETY